MSIKIFNKSEDLVIGGVVSLGEATYKYALSHIWPLIDRFEAQRKSLDSKFYERLEKDILTGCLMPPLTIAFVETEVQFATTQNIEAYVTENISNGYVLDGLQRLHTLKRASDNQTGTLNLNKPIFFNIIISGNKDRLLYRMITLNNGQKPMSARHQIEILTQELFDFSGLTIKVQTEKEKSEEPIKDAFSVGNISKGYTAFLTGNVNNENSKIIEEKMDQILVNRILDSDIADLQIQFSDVIKLIDSLSQNEANRIWLQVSNNLIGFCVGIKKTFEYVKSLPIEDVSSAFERFDKAFSIVNPSKVNVGKFRRELSFHFVENAPEMFHKNESQLADSFFNLTLSE